MNAATSCGCTRSSIALKSIWRLRTETFEAPGRAAACWPPASTSRCSVMKTPSLRSAWRNALGPSASRVPVTDLPAVLSPFQL